MSTNKLQMPILFIPHGGGPMPLLGEPNHRSLCEFIKNIDTNYLANLERKPAAILMISAHWEEPVATVSSAAAPDMLYDYYGFPPESYEIEYPALGDKQLATHILTLLQQQGIESKLDSERGFDHGTFVPLKLMYPQADIPVVQLSLVNSLDPQSHLDIGAAIASIAEQGVLVIGSGFTFHNMQALLQNMRSPMESTLQKSKEFDLWLNTAVKEHGGSSQEGQQQIVDWKNAPQALFAHPREEHLLPLLVCMGAAQELQYTPENIFDETFLGVKTSGFIWR